MFECTCPSHWRAYLCHVKQLGVYLLSLDGILGYRRLTPSRQDLSTHLNGETFCESAETQQDDPGKALNLERSLPSPAPLPLRHHASHVMVNNAHHRDDSIQRPVSNMSCPSSISTVPQAMLPYPETRNIKYAV